MTTMTIIINERKKGGRALKALIEAMEDQSIVEIVKTPNEDDNSPYDPEFVNKIKRAEKQKGTIVNPNDVWGSLGLK